MSSTTITTAEQLFALDSFQELQVAWKFVSYDLAHDEEVLFELIKKHPLILRMVPEDVKSRANFAISILPYVSLRDIDQFPQSLKYNKVFLERLYKRGFEFFTAFIRDQSETCDLCKAFLIRHLNETTTSVDSFNWPRKYNQDREVLEVIVKNGCHHLISYDLPKIFDNHPDLLLEFAKNTNLSFIGRLSDKLLNDPVIIIPILRAKPKLYWDLPMKLRKNSMYAIAVVENHPKITIDIRDNSLENDVEFAAAYVKHEGSRLALFSKVVRENAEVVKIAVLNDFEAFQFASLKIRENSDLQKLVLQQEEKDHKERIQRIQALFE